jgi:hypothetical protein
LLKLEEVMAMTNIGKSMLYRLMAPASSVRRQGWQLGGALARLGHHAPTLLSAKRRGM